MIALASNPRLAQGNLETTHCQSQKPLFGESQK